MGTCVDISCFDAWPPWI